VCTAKSRRATRAAFPHPIAASARDTGVATYPNAGIFALRIVAFGPLNVAFAHQIPIFNKAKMLVVKVQRDAHRSSGPPIVDKPVD
jgi:hypothetical protein